MDGSNGDAFLYFALNPDLFGSQGGDYTLEIDDGTVVQAEESGVYSSLPLPTLNSAVGSFSVSVPQWDYQLPSLINSDDSYEVDIDDEGIVDGTNVPEPAGLGLLAAAAVAVTRRRRTV